MKLLLTSAGVTNPTIRRALEGLLDKPISESTALCIPTAQYGHPWLGPGVKGQDNLKTTSNDRKQEKFCTSFGLSIQLHCDMTRKKKR